MLQAIRKILNRHFLDRSDPAQGLGTRLPGFSLANIYPAGTHANVTSLSSEVYNDVISKLQEGRLPYVAYSVVDYEDAQHARIEGVRRYIIMERYTVRGTRITILARFLPYGRRLYVGIDSYAQGPVDVFQIVLRTLATIFPAYTFFPLPFVGKILALAWLTMVTPILWMRLIRNLWTERNFAVAINQSYNKKIDDKSFDFDDTMMTLKSALPLMIGSVIQVLERYGIEVEALKQFLTFIQNVQNIHNINNYASNMGTQGVFNTAAQQVKSAVGSRTP